MRQQSDEKQQSRQSGERPDHGRSPLRVAGLELRAQRHGDQQRDDEPTVVETDLDAEQAPEPDGRVHRPPLSIPTTYRAATVREPVTAAPADRTAPAARSDRDRGP